MCSCPERMTGNAFLECRPILLGTLHTMFSSCLNYTMTCNHSIVSISFSDTPLTHPCQPSPCGPNSQCKEINNQAVCSCAPNNIGAPPNCRPECTISAECPLSEACSNQRCVNPCVGTCGVNAECKVVNHSPICSCPTSFSGDPFSRCYKLRTYLIFSLDQYRNISIISKLCN